MKNARYLLFIGIFAVLYVGWNLQHSVISTVATDSLVSEEPAVIELDVEKSMDQAVPAVQPVLSLEMPIEQIANSAPVLAINDPHWKPRVMSYAGGLFGTNIAPPIASSSDRWCQIELMDMPSNVPSYSYDPVCEEEPLRQGNFSTLEDVLQFQAMPHTDPTSYQRVTQEERAAYWVDNGDPYIAHCRSCKGSLVHKTLYRARRWWRLRNWRRRLASSGPLARISGSFIGVHQDHFTTRRGTISTSGFTFEPFNGTYDLTIPFSSITRIQICVGSDAFIQLALEEGGEIVMQTQTLLYGAKCFWRTLQLLFPDSLANRVYLLPNETCSFNHALQTSQSLEASSVPMPKDDSFRFTPCYRNDITNLSRVIDANGMMGKRKNFWPFTCDYLRNTDNCGQRKRIAALSAGVNQDIRVAVALAGFVRSFASARSFIFDNMIRPHNATLFGAVWNVVGRAKKTVEVHKKMTVRPGVMYNTLAPLFGIQPNETIRRLEVLEYFRHLRAHKVLQANGLLHPGLYFTLVRSLRLVYESNLPFDIVIRSRFDMFAAVPFFFTRLRSDQQGTSSAGTEYAIDVGSSCFMDSAWWPQFAKFGEGKVLKHYADTRMKYFSWQVCDWVDVGTYNTMKTLTTMFDWMVEQNVHSAAQFVDHAFFLDHNLTYFPMQLYLKIARHKTQLFG